MESYDRGIFEGEVLAEIKNLTKSFDEFKAEFKEFKKDSGNKIEKNSKDISGQKGIMAGLSIVGGFIGGFVRGMLFKS